MVSGKYAVSIESFLMPITRSRMEYDFNETIEQAIEAAETSLCAMFPSDGFPSNSHQLDVNARRKTGVLW